MTSSWFFLSTLNYDARSTTHQICRTVSAFWPVTGSNANLKKVGLRRLIRARSTNLCTNRRSHENLRRRNAVSIYATVPTISATIRPYHLRYIKAGINGSR